MTKKLIEELRKTIKEYDKLFKEKYGNDGITNNYEEYDEIFALVSTINQYKQWIKDLKSE